ncbi:hypothetical protein LCGC14_1727800 [marine sediment metagenome]|uniref:Uncharacterized protein n=1 Tax=marine sediment metagenome TaxID=412755 RepID=A0A0F9HAH7_9ZZZZ
MMETLFLICLFVGIPLMAWAFSRISNKLIERAVQNDPVLIKFKNIRKDFEETGNFEKFYSEFRQMEYQGDFY